MSIEAIAKTLHTTAPDPRSKLVLLGLANHADSHGGHAWPSVATLAAYADCSERTVQRCLRTLEDEGLIVRADWQPDHIRIDRRPVCYQITVARNDTDVRGDTHVTPHDGRGVTSEVERGDTCVTRTVSEPTPVGTQPSYAKRLAQTLQSEHDWQPPDDLGSQPFHTRYRTLLTTAARLLPDQQHNIAMGVIADYWKAADPDSTPLPPPTRSHLGRLVRRYGGVAVLDAIGEALQWGAGARPEDQSDPRALTKYATAVLTRQEAAA